MAKVAIDCDGVLANFQVAFFKEANRIWPGRVDLDYEPSGWNDLGGLSGAEISRVWRNIVATPNWWLYAPALRENMAEFQVFLRTQRYHDVYIVTSRTPTKGMSVAKQTAIWLDQCDVEPNLNYLGVIVADNPPDKRRIYEAAGFGYSVDDKGTTVEECDTLEGHQAFLLDAPWNQEAKVKRRIKSLSEFFSAIKAAK